MVKKSTKIYPLGKSAAASKLTFVNMSGKPFNMVAPADYSFWEMLNQVVQEEPTDSVDATTLGFWASVGIVKGKPFSPDARMKKILTEAAGVGDATGRALGYRVRMKDAYFFDNREWKRASSSRCTSGTALPVRRRAWTKVKPPYQTRSRWPAASPSTVAG